MNARDFAIRALKRAQIDWLRMELERLPEGDWTASIGGRLLDTLGPAPTDRAIELVVDALYVGAKRAIEGAANRKLTRMAESRARSRTANEAKKREMLKNLDRFYEAYRESRVGRVTHTQAIAVAERACELGTGTGRRYAKLLGLAARKSSE